MQTYAKYFGKGPLAFKSNAFNMLPDAGLFINASRFNHSCLPNCVRKYVRDHGLMVISAGKDIACGDELTIEYTTLHYKDGYEKH